MEETEMRVKDILNKLRQELDCDFSSLAIVDRRDRAACWRWASGNLNERYSNICVQHGQGLEGEIIKVGRGLAWDRSGSRKDKLYAQYSILLTEQLESAYATPIIDRWDIIGILLAGDRGKRIYTASERGLIEQTASSVAEVVHILIG